MPSVICLRWGTEDNADASDCDAGEDAPDDADAIGEIITLLDEVDHDCDIDADATETGPRELTGEMRRSADVCSLCS